MIVRSLFKKPATLMYPIVKREWVEGTRGNIQIEMKDCILCGICSKKCPTDALEVSRSEGSWSIHRMQCIQCNSCVDVCPKKCLLNLPDYTAPNVVKVVDSYKAEPAGEVSV
jgi:formate hydrogenlyase subunit 6/NADH:ubiquinone oxidoreductase subunit I